MNKSITFAICIKIATDIFALLFLLGRAVGICSLAPAIGLFVGPGSQVESERNGGRCLKVFLFFGNIRRPRLSWLGTVWRQQFSRQFVHGAARINVNNLGYWRSFARLLL